MPATESRQEFLARLQRDRAAFERTEPELQLTVRDPHLGVEGYVVVWNVPHEGGMAKGGTRVTPSVSLSEVGMLARTMALKNAAAGLPLGGAKSGIRGDPTAPGFKAQFQSIARRFMPLFPEHGGPFGGLGFDIGGRPEFVDWFIEATGMPQRFTGKPAALGGTDYDRHGIAGLGVAVAARTALESRGGSAQGKRFAVQGLGAMGAGVVKTFAAAGGVLTWVSDPFAGGAFELPENLDPGRRAALVDAIGAMDRPRVTALLAQHGVPLRAPEDVLTQPADVLFPCAVQDVIHAGNVESIRAPLIAEGANGPCSPALRERLHQQGSLVLPDFLANSGGIIAAYVEMTERGGDKAALAARRTEEIIAANVRAALEDSERHGVSPADAALARALQRIVRRG